MDLYGYAARSVLQPMARWRDGRRHFTRYYHEFARTQYLPPEKLRELQLRRLRALLRHAYDHTAYYRRQFAEAGITPDAIRSLEDLCKLPPLSKQGVRAHLPELLADTYELAHLRRDQTGGSTGIPLIFYRDCARGDARLALGFRHDGWTGWRPGERTAYIWGAPRDFGRSLRWRLVSRFVHRRATLDAGWLDEQGMEHFARELGKWRPALIVAYSGSAHLFAKFLLQRGLQVPPARGVVCTAELLYPHQRREIEQAMGARVFERYGARETGLLASECDRHRGMHIASDSVYIEAEIDGRAAAPGEPGEVIVTDLLNFGMPMIRYQLGDIVVLSDRRCDCGRSLPLMEMVSGRISEHLVTPSGSMISGAYLAQVIGHRPGLAQVQFVQYERELVHIRVVLGEEFTRADLDYVGAKFAEMAGPDLGFRFDIVPEIPRGPAGKHHLCICEVPTDLSRQDTVCADEA